MKYKLLTSDDADKLSHCVQRYLDDGYELHGTPFLGDKARLHQLVILPQDGDRKPYTCIKPGCLVEADDDSNYCRIHKPDPWAHL